MNQLAILSITADTLQIIRKFINNSELPMQTIQTYLYITKHGEVPLSDLEKVTGLSQSAVSRNVAKLGQGLTARDPGFGLVEAYEDPNFRRRKLVRLTPRGKALAQEVANVLGPRLAKLLKKERAA